MRLHASKHEADAAAAAACSPLLVPLSPMAECKQYIAKIIHPQLKDFLPPELCSHCGIRTSSCGVVHLDSLFAGSSAQTTCFADAEYTQT